MELQDKHLEEYEPIPPRPLWVKLMRSLVAIIAAVSLLYLSGIHQYFFYQRTPDSIQQPVLASKVEGEEISIPVHIHVLVGETGSDRNDEDGKRLIENSNNIWSQANIRFHIQEINYIEATSEEIREFKLNPHSYIQRSNSYNPSVANIYFSRTLDGVNGLAYGGTTAVSVADYTASLDFRTLAHEFGHLLGLPHVNSNTELMSSGGRGTNLSLEEIAIARSNAQKSFVASDE